MSRHFSLRFLLEFETLLVGCRSATTRFYILENIINLSDRGFNEKWYFICFYNYQDFVEVNRKDNDLGSYPKPLSTLRSILREPHNRCVYFQHFKLNVKAKLNWTLINSRYISKLAKFKISMFNQISKVSLYLRNY